MLKCTSYPHLHGVYVNWFVHGHIVAVGKTRWAISIILLPYNSGAVSLLFIIMHNIALIIIILQGSGALYVPRTCVYNIAALSWCFDLLYIGKI